MSTLHCKTAREIKPSTSVLDHIISVEDEEKQTEQKSARLTQQVTQDVKSQFPDQSLANQSPDYSWATPLIKDMERGDWESFKRKLGQVPSPKTSTPINSRRETFLHHAVDTGNVPFVRELVKVMSPEELELKTSVGDHALISAATGGIKEIAEIMLERNTRLAGIPSQYGLLPIIIAVRNGNKDIAEYLYSQTPLEQLDPERTENGARVDSAGINGARLLIAAIISDMYDLALKLLGKYPKLAIACDNHRRNAATILAERPSAFASGYRHGLLEGIIYRGWYSTQNSVKVTAEIIQLLYLGVSVLSGTRYLETHLGGHPRDSKTRSSKISYVTKGLQRFFWGAIKDMSVPGFHIKEMHEKQLLHLKALSVLKIITTQLSTLDESKLYEARGYRATIEASRFGIIEMVSELITCNPELQFSLDGKARDIFHMAILHRRENVFNLIYEMKNKKMISVRADTSNNTLLHAAGSRTPSSQHNRISGAALQMQSELQWFKEVERLVPPRFKEEVNKDQKTARELFTENHKEMLKEGEGWMKATAESCMVVATLIAAVMFTAAFTVPGGNDGRTGLPILLRTRLFMIFVVTDALSLFFSLTSLLMFLAILTSRYAEEDFIFLLPRKMILGLTALFFSVVFMLASFSTTLFIVLEHRAIWVAILSTVIASLPVALFIRLQFPLLVDMVSPTFGPSIFGKKYKGLHL